MLLSQGDNRLESREDRELREALETIERLEIEAATTSSIMEQ